MKDEHLRPGRRDGVNVMNRSDLTRRLVGKLRNEAVIGGIGNSNFDLWGSGQRPQNFYMLGSMGLAVPIALGVAMAQPQRRVFALEGDGSLLMQLGSLGLVAKIGPPNLTIVVWDNGAYQITGSQPTLTDTGVDLVAVAIASGLTQSAWAEDERHFEHLVDSALEYDGPRFICARTDNQPPAATTERDPAKIRITFMEGIRVTPEPTHENQVGA